MHTDMVVAAVYNALFTPFPSEFLFGCTKMGSILDHHGWPGLRTQWQFKLYIKGDTLLFINSPVNEGPTTVTS